jgi:hypothetical protein
MMSPPERARGHAKENLKYFQAAEEIIITINAPIIY